MNHPIRILYVDDYALDRELIRDALEKEHTGFIVTEAFSHNDFIAKLAQGEYDLVLSDFNILGYEGLQIIDAVHAKNPSTPIIIVTGTGSEEIAVEALKHGAADYIIKSPKHILRLPQTIHAVIDRRNLQEERDRLFNYSIDLLSITDFNGYFRQLNPAWEATLGWSIKELLSRPFIEFVHPDDRAATLEVARNLTEGLSIYSFENRYLCKDGSIRWLSWNSSPLLGEKMVFSVSRDITDRKQDEQIIRESEDKFSKVFHASPVPMSINRASDWAFVDVNESFLKGIGYTREELIGRTLMDIGVWDDSDELAQIQTLIDDTGSLQDYETKFRKKSGEIGDALVFREPIELNGERHYIGTTLDITERKQAENEIRQANAELEQRVQERTAELEAVVKELEALNKEMGAFSYSVSHDLRAPLRAIEGYAEIIENDYARLLDAEGQRLLNVIRANTQKMDRLITDLLTLSRVSRVELNFSRIDMTRLAQATYDEIASIASSHKFDFQISVLPVAFGDPILLRQVWTNLISNAVKYTSPRNERRIEIGGYVNNKTNVYYVKDTGVGFDPALANRLFTPFQRLHSSEAFEGSGVGLAIVQQIIKRHGGTTWAEGQIDQGATMYFSLPVKPA